MQVAALCPVQDHVPMVWISLPISFQERSQPLEMIQVSTFYMYKRVYRFKPTIVFSAIVVEMDIEQVAVM